MLFILLLFKSVLGACTNNEMGFTVSSNFLEKVVALMNVKNQLVHTMTGYDSTGVVLLEGSITYQDAKDNEKKQII
jgi:hypothetical protein